MLGHSLKRKEDPRLLRGGGRYTDDIAPPGALRVVFLRSQVAHARILRLDLERARSAPGVVAVYRAADLPLQEIPALARVDGMHCPLHLALARDRITYYGEPLAVVVAASRAQADDAIDLIGLEIEELPAVVDLDQALLPDSPRVHPDHPDNIAYRWVPPGPPAPFPETPEGRPFQQRIRNPRLIPSALETRAIVAEYDSQREELTLHASCQRPHLLRWQLAVALQLPETQVRVIAPDVGGGFGSKFNVYGEEIILALLARQLGRPLRWTETRAENCASTHHGRGQIADVEFWVRDDATLSALRCHIYSDVGAHHQLLSTAIPPLTALMLSGPYRIPHIQVSITGVFTHKVPTDAYRGAGKPEATFVLERIIDIIAARFQLDPVEVRRRNFFPPSPQPFPVATGIFYDSCNYQAALTRALEMLDYPHWRQRQDQARQTPGATKLLGIGLSCFVEMAGVGPSFIIPGGGWEYASVRIDRACQTTVLTGICPHGQGSHTSLAQIVAHQLGVDPHSVTVRHGDTHLIPQGVGTWGSRGTTLGGTAVWTALQKLKSKLDQIALHMLKLDDPSQLRFHQGGYGPLEAPQPVLPLIAVVNYAYDAVGLPPGLEPGMEASAHFDPPNFTFPSGTHAVVVEVDRRSGDWTILRYVSVDDCGTVVNPLLVDGQVHGGIAQGLGQILNEEVLYDPQGRLLSRELTHYALPRAHDMPWIETDLIQTPSTSNPLGLKGVGESGTIGAPAAVVNALIDALRQSGLDILHLDPPVRPQKLWELLQ